jgi:hypothetical protein
LLHAKSGVATIKQVNFPRLELFAAMIGARLAVSVKKDFDQEYVTLSFGSDSSAGTAWIKTEDQWGIFVWKRLRK